MIPDMKFRTVIEWQILMKQVKTEAELEALVREFVGEVGAATGYQADFGFAHSVLDDFNFGDKIITSCLKTDEIVKDIESAISMMKPAKDDGDHYIRSVNLDWHLEGVLMTTGFLKAIMLVSKDIRGDN